MLLHMLTTASVYKDQNLTQCPDFEQYAGKRHRVGQGACAKRLVAENSGFEGAQ